MCIIIVKPAKANMPSLEIIRRCAFKNPHGFGFAIPGQKPFKTCDYRAFEKELLKVDENQPVIMHFRYATHGSIKKSNCHPFRDDYNGITFAHNGVLGIYPINDLTDSETAFRYLLSPAIDRYGLRSKKFKDAVSSIIGVSRFVFMSDKGDIIKFGTWHELGGCYYSNIGFK